MKLHFSIFIFALFILLNGCNGHPSDLKKDASRPPKSAEADNAKALALKRCLRLTQLNLISKKYSIRRITVKKDNTPFLWKQIQGKALWRIEFDECTLKLKSYPELTDKYPLKRTFVVLMGGDEKTGVILKISCHFSGNRDNIESRPIPVQSVEKRMRDLGRHWIFTGFPKMEPKVSFLQAVAASDTDAFASKEFYGLYVMCSELGYASPRPVWIINFRGTPPYSLTDNPAPPIFHSDSPSGGEHEEKQPPEPLPWWASGDFSIVNPKNGKLLEFGGPRIY